MSFESLSILRQTYCCPMNFGLVVSHDNILDSDYKKIIPYVFDSIMCKNEMKPNSIRTNSGVTITNYDTSATYNYTESDEIVKFAKERRMKVVGNVLWSEPNNLPQFVIDLSNNGSFTTNPNLMSNIVSSHFRNIMKNFNNKAQNSVHVWYVTNEALDASGNVKNTQIIHRLLGGNSSFSNLFQYAQNVITPPREPLPGPAPAPRPAQAPRPAPAPAPVPRPDLIINGNTKLFYNDSLTNLTQDGVFNKLKSLKDSKILDGIGIQCHNVSNDILNTITLKYIQEGFIVHFIEVSENHGLIRYYEDVIDIALKYGVQNFTVSGLIDVTSPPLPLLFNPSFQPKESYNALIRKMNNFGSQIYDIIIVFGQSNSEGYGRTEWTFDNIPATRSTYDMRTKPFYNDDFNNKFDDRIRTFSYDNRIVPAFERPASFGQVGDRTAYGFGVSFARQYVKEGKLATGRKVLVISCAYGGTGFFKEKAYKWNHYIRNNLYDKTIKRIKAAKLAINSSSQVKAMLWHQGENDVAPIFNFMLNSGANPTGITSTDISNINTNINNSRIELGISITRSIDLTSTTAFTEVEKKNIYTQSLLATLNGVRDEIRGSISANSIPILLGGLCPSLYINHRIGPDPHDETTTPSLANQYMNNLISTICANNSISNYKFVSSDPIPAVEDFNHYLKGNYPVRDRVHFNKSSQIEFGKRYFYVYNGNSINLSLPPSPAPSR